MEAMQCTQVDFRVPILDQMDILIYRRIITIIITTTINAKQHQPLTAAIRRTQHRLPLNQSVTPVVQ